MAKGKPILGENLTILPFLKWAGGKRWLLARYPELFPKNFERYIEPFVGSGALFFKLKPAFAILGDFNFELIETYRAIKRDWKKVQNGLNMHHKNHSINYYYKVRKQNLRSPFTKAARLIYLNRTCWNGLFRVNLNGKFNVPIGTKTNVILKSDDFKNVSKLLKNSKLIASDFEKVIDQAKRGDFIFCDPPYTVQHNNNNFIKYNNKLFKWDDQIRLRDCLLRAQKRGSKIVLANAHHFSIRELYEDHFELLPLSRKNIIAADASKRNQIEELIIRSKV